MSQKSQKTRISEEVQEIAIQLNQHIDDGTPFISRISITVQKNTAIHLRHRIQTNMHQSFFTEVNLIDSLVRFGLQIERWFKEHSYFSAWIEFSFDGKTLRFNPPTCESSVRLTAQ